jgi:hypothetical protein
MVTSSVFSICGFNSWATSLTSTSAGGAIIYERIDLFETSEDFFCLIRVAQDTNINALKRARPTGLVFSRST